MPENQKISIIIPTKNREAILKLTLQKAIEATENTDAEIIVVNDGNELKEKIQNEKIQYHANPKQGVSVARNFGANLAAADTLLFLDDDMWITKATIAAIAYIKNNVNLDNNAVCLNWIYPDGLIKRCTTTKIGRYYLKNNYHTQIGRNGLTVLSDEKIIGNKGIGSASFVISKKVFDAIGGYNEQIIFQGEDIDMYDKLIKNNIYTNIYTPISCFHNDNTVSNIQDYIKRQYSGYYSQVQAEKNHLIKNQFPDRNSLKNKIYRLLLPVEGVLIFIFNIMPNHKIFDVITFRIIGILGAFQKVKAYKQILK
jgi:glycosyltransferase involved in cell wall biosynthesis